MKESVIADLRALGRTEGRAVLKEALALLAADPLAETRKLKTLRPNPVAQRELRLSGRYRLLFTVDPGQREVTIVLAGEKRGDALIVQGKRFRAHESGSAQ